MNSRKVLAALVALTALLAATATASAAFASNDASITIRGSHGAAAACQLLVLVNVVIILDVEDGLGLVTVASDHPPSLHVPEAASAYTGSLAECSLLLQRLRVVYAEGSGGPRGTYVSGPPLAAASTPVLTNAWHIQVAEGSQAALCQRLILIDSTVLGGGAYGLPVGASDSFLELENNVTVGSGATARCDARVGHIEVVSGTG